jgi:type IV pilus assembly protein PilB
MTLNSKHKFLDEWLVNLLKVNHIIDDKFLEESRARYSDYHYFFDVLIEHDFLSKDDIAMFIESYVKIPFVNLDETEIMSEAVKAVPENICQKYQLFPVKINNNEIEIAFANPFELDAENVLASLTRRYVKYYFSFRSQIERKIVEYYSPNKFIDNLVDRVKIDSDVIFSGQMKADQNVPVVKLVNLLLSDAIGRNASDIHIEPKERNVAVRYRIDGVLNNILEIPKALQSSLISRIKIVSNIDIAESRVPQDGSAKVMHAGTKVDLRLSTIPTNYGEKIVIRILDERKANISLNHLGVSNRNLKLLKKCFNKTQGFILVSGPTGSGKTTTLYAALNDIRSSKKNIITIEDPVEYKIEGINQVQVNKKTGVTFASALRSFLRQDPDVMLVGEIRDQETVEIAIQASLTGHLVLSTIHSNHVLGSLTRIVDMGVDLNKILASLEVIIAQRLLRKLCVHCRKELLPNEIDKNLARIVSKYKGTAKLYQPTGCSQCGYMGYKGRVGIFEILSMTDELKQMILDHEPETLIRKKAREGGYRTLYEDALDNVLEGITDYKELLRVITYGQMDDKEITRELIFENSSGIKEKGFRKDSPSMRKSGAGHTHLISHVSRTDLENATSLELEGIDQNEYTIPKILILDDDLHFLKMVKIMVEKSTYWQIYTANTPQKAFEVINKNRIDLILLDVMMPNVDGYTMLKKFRSNLATATTPIIMLTALKNNENEIKGLRLGADDFIIKPFDFDIFKARIVRLLQKNNINY